MGCVVCRVGCTSRPAVGWCQAGLWSLRTVWLPQRPSCWESNLSYLMAISLPDRRKCCFSGCLCILASPFGMPSIFYIEIGSGPLSILLFRTRTDLTVLDVCGCARNATKRPPAAEDKSLQRAATLTLHTCPSQLCP